MKTPKIKIEDTTTNTERLLFFLCFMAMVTEERRGDFLLDVCMSRMVREEKGETRKYREALTRYDREKLMLIYQFL
jgi:hypothetical protein